MGLGSLPIGITFNLTSPLLAALIAAGLIST